MKIKIIASGSKGNCTVIESNKTIILIDVGLSYKMTKERLTESSLDVNNIDGIFITHEHIDHIKGLAMFIKKHEIPIYLSIGTYKALCSKRIGIDYNNYRILECDEEVTIGEFNIRAFDISHDASEPFGYVVYENDKKLVYLTDTGFVSQVNEKKIKNADVYILETNHNVEMLMCSNRPWPLKQRIIGDYGHLCNEDALDVLNRVKGENTKYVYLAHISDEANNHDILKLTVNQKCTNRIKYMIAYQHSLSEVVEV